MLGVYIIYNRTGKWISKHVEMDDVFTRSEV